MSQKYFWQTYAREEVDHFSAKVPEVYNRGPVRFWLEYWSEQKPDPSVDMDKILPIDMPDRTLLCTGQHPLLYYSQFPELSAWHKETRHLGPETPGQTSGMNLVYRVAFQPKDGKIYLPVCIRIFYGGCSREKNWPLMLWETLPLYFYQKDKRV